MFASVHRGLVRLSVLVPLAPLEAGVLLNEILCDPSGPESADEFIELLNAGADSVDLAGWTLDDGADSDGFVGLGGGLRLAPGARAVVFDSGHEGDWDDRVPADALRLAIDDASFGANGLSNSSPETLRLVDPGGAPVDSTTTRPGLGPDTGWERIEDGAGCPSCWAPSPPGAASPGGRNAGRPRDLDLAVVALGAGWLDLRATGRAGFAGELLVSQGLAPCLDTLRVELAGGPEAGWRIALPEPPLFGWNPLRVDSRAGEDRRRLDTLLWAEPTGRRLGVDEVDNSGPDWTELRLEGPCPCRLDGLRLTTRSGRHELAGDLPPGGRLMLGPLPPDCPDAVWLPADPVLARDGSLRLETTGGRLLESAQWPAEAGAWQRLGFERPAEDGGSWVRRPGTPGCPPDLPAPADGGGFAVSSRRLLRSGPPRTALLRIDGPATGFSFEVWSRAGRRRLRVDCRGAFCYWDGRDGSGAALPAGVWLLRLAAPGQERLLSVVLLD